MILAWILLLGNSVFAMQDYSKFKIAVVKINSKQGWKKLTQFFHRGADGMVFIDVPDSFSTEVKVIVDAINEKNLRDEMSKIGSNVKVLKANVTELVEKTLPLAEDRNTKREDSSFDYAQYQPLSKINGELRRLAVKHSEISSLFSLGTSFENREMLAFKISRGADGKKIIFLQCGIHAREWISHATCMYIIRQLVAKYEAGDRRVRRLIDLYDWVIVPVINVDGYVYTHEVDRLWRKTRSQTGNPSCFGADANRNWPYQFGGSHTSEDPCSPLYKGTHPLSEVEVKNVVDYLKSIKSKLKAFYTFHAFGQYLLYPWAYTSTPTPDAAELDRVGNAMSKALKKVDGTEYRVGTPPSLVYPVGGSSMDFVYGGLGVTYTFCFELRGKSQLVNFLLPADQIISTGKETLAAILKGVELFQK